MINTNQRDHASLAAVYSELPFGEQLVLWGIRMWVRAFNQGDNNHSVLQKGFSLAGVAEAYGALDAIMDVLSQSGQGVVDIRCTCSSEISFDEHRIIGALAACQYEKHYSSRDAYLSVWLPPAASLTAYLHVFELANVLKKGGLMLNLRVWARDLSFESEFQGFGITHSQLVH